MVNAYSTLIGPSASGRVYVAVGETVILMTSPFYPY